MTPLSLPDTRAQAASQLRRVEEALDAHRMGPRLRAAVGAAGRSCHVLDAKYEPGLRCIVLYRAGGLLVRGDLLDDGCEGGASPRPVVEPGVRLSCFPDDPDLPTLGDVADPATLREALQDALPGAGPILRCRVDLLRYRPGKRATLAVELRRRGDGGARRQRWIGKSYHDGRKAAAVAAEAGLLDAAVDPSAPLRLAPVAAHLPHLSLLVQQHVGGVHLDELLRRPGPPAAGALHRAAVALAALHRQPAVSRRIRAVDAELRRFQARSRRVAQVDPCTGAALERLADRLAATAQDVPAGVTGLVHGDCKPSQFLLPDHGHVDEGRVLLLDLDSCGRADPAGDVGTFVATLRQHGVRQALARRAAASPTAATASLAEAFLRAYVDAAGAQPAAELRRRIDWYEAVALERKALRAFARAPRSPLTGALVVQGHACLDRLGGTP